MKNKVIAIVILIILVVIVAINVGWDIYVYKDCLFVGHSKLYCFWKFLWG